MAELRVGMRANLELTAAAGRPGRPARLVRRRDAAPLAWRGTADAVYLISTAANPVGSDEVAITIDVEPGAHLAVRTAAATIAWHGPGSTQTVAVTVGDGATLEWRPEPLIATAGCDHRQTVSLRLLGTGRVRWQEEILLGRRHERPGRLDLRFHVDVDERPLLRHHLAVGGGRPGWDGPAVLGDHRAAGFLLQAGAGLPSCPAAAGPGWARLPLQGPGSLLTTLGADLPDIRRALADGAAG